jgi:hypothetical protein
MRVIACALLAACLGSSPSWAQTAFPANTPVEDGELGHIAGQADLSQIAAATNQATVSGNTIAGNSSNGAISFGPSSFQGGNGLSIVSANTGSNVAINSAMTVNVAIHP